MTAVVVENLTHRYRDATALEQVNLTVNPGESFGILGPNGGGKSTLFRILATLLRPAAGRAAIFDHDVAAQPAAVRADLGVVFQNPSLDVKLTARENLIHQGRLYGLSGADLGQRTDTWLKRIALDDRADDLVESFSGGMRRRVELAKAMLHRPRLLLMDEPDTGLDPGARRDLWNYLIQLRQDSDLTCLMTTHLMEMADRCDRLAVIDRGRIVDVDTPANLKASIRGDVITIHADGPGDLVQPLTDRFGPWADDAAPRVVDSTIHLEKPDGPTAVAGISQAFPDRIRSITVGQPTLEDVFLHLTGHSLGEE